MSRTRATIVIPYSDTLLHPETLNDINSLLTATKELDKRTQNYQFPYESESFITQLHDYLFYHIQQFFTIDLNQDKPNLPPTTYIIKPTDTTLTTLSMYLYHGSEYMKTSFKYTEYLQ